MKTFLKHYWYSVVLCLGFWWVMALGQPVAVQAQDDPGNGSISGVVTNAQGNGVPNIYVTSYVRAGEPGNFYPQPVSSVLTDGNGAYTMTNLFSGTYQLSFDDTRLPPLYANEFYNNVASWPEATDIPVGIGATVTGIDATIGRLGQISGTVTNGAGNPIPGLFVIPFKIPNDGQQYNAATTDSSGAYTVTGLAPSVYGLYFEALPQFPYQSEYYDNVFTQASAQGITVTVDATVSNIDAQLGKRGRIQGVVTDENGNFLPNISVSFFYSDTLSSAWLPINTKTTAADGSYDAELWNPGIYRVEFRDQHNPQRYQNEYYNNRMTFEEATDIAVTVDAVVSGTNATLTAIDLPGGIISGTVTNNIGNPLGLIHVLAYRVEDATPESNNWPIASDDFTNAQGHYKLMGLAPGTYRVEFRDDGQTPQYAAEFYDNAATIDAATDIPVVENAVIGHQDSQLGRRSSISGRVTDLEGNPPNPPDSVFVMLSRDPTGAGNWNFLYGVNLDANGVYTFPSLDPGIYHVGFMGATGYRHLYNPEYYDDAPFFSQATPIVVAPETDVTGIDARLGPQGSIYGRVTDSEGNPLVGLPTTLYHFDLDINGGTWRSLGPLSTEDNGIYRWGGLRYGAYRLHVAETNAHVAEFYQDAVTFETATTLTLTKAAPALTDIDVQLASKGYLTGKITNKQGEPLSGIKVHAYVPQESGNGGILWNLSKQGETDGAGNYKLFDLPNGIVRLGFVDETNHYVFEYYDDARTVETATDITVSATAVLTINAQLATFGRITGTVTTETGQPLPGISVLLHQESPLSNGDTYWAQYWSRTTDENGRYAFLGLLGRYRISFADQRTFPGEYRYEFYNNVATLEEATDLLVTPGMDFTDIDAQLTQLGRIHGIVTNEQGEPIPDVGVTVAFDPPGNDSWQPHLANATTDSTGAYTLLSLETGAYRLYFSERAAIHHYSSEYYENAATFTAATTIQVTNAMTTMIDVTLAPTGGISGNVTGPDNQPLPGMLVVLWGDQDGNGQWERTNLVAATVDANGVYTFTGVDVGAYRVSFHDPTTLVYAPEFYNNALTIDAATNVTVTAGVITPHIDARLDYYSHITGQVTDEAEAPLPNIYVEAYAWQANQYGAVGWQAISSRYTNEQGQYNLSGLVPGVYRLRFIDPSYVRHPEYYDDAGYIDTATDITLGVAMTVTNINAQLLPFASVNYPPLARNDAIKVRENGVTTTLQPGVYSLSANDLDAENHVLTATLVTSPTHGTIMLNSDGTFTYTHNADGATVDYFTYKVNDGVYDSNVATVTVAITQTNDAPLAVNDNYTLTTGAILTGSNALDNDSDEESAILTATLVTSPTHGALTLAANGIFTYTHGGGETLTDTFTYVASDGITTSNVATVNLVISPTTPLVSFTLSKTVGIAGIEPLCTAKGEMKVPVGTAVVYCYTVRNTGSATLTTHSLVDSDLGQLLNSITYTLSPGAIYSVTFTKTLTVSITNVATWTVAIADVAQALQRTIPGATGGAATAATVLISGPTDDQDGDTIPDNLEGWNDPDGDNIPNFLDTNADGDSKSDQEEVGDPTKPTDSDQDGIPDFLDSDGSLPGLNLRQFLPLIHK